MPLRPSHLWKELPLDTRIAAAHAFWSDDESNDAVGRHVEAIVAIARRLNFRPKSIQALPVERRARQLAQLTDVSDAIAARALIAYHFASARPMMTAFLDALGIAHENGLITAETVQAPEQARLAAAVEHLRAQFPADAVALYLKTLAAVDEDTWGGLERI